jgi:hypothetical protein
MQPARPLTCASCGYDLSGTPVVGNEITCPECGGHRVRMAQWWEPRCSRRWMAAHAVLALLGAAPTLAALWMLSPVGGGRPVTFAGAMPPFVLLAILLAAWRPAGAVGVVVAGSTSMAALVVVLYGLTFGFLCLPLGVTAALLYYAVPIPVGVLLARTAFRV